MLTYLNHPKTILPQVCGTTVATKLVSGAKKVGAYCLKGLVSKKEVPKMKLTTSKKEVLKMKLNTPKYLTSCKIFCASSCVSKVTKPYLNKSINHYIRTLH